MRNHSDKHSMGLTIYAAFVRAKIMFTQERGDTNLLRTRCHLGTDNWSIDTYVSLPSTLKNTCGYPIRLSYELMVRVRCELITKSLHKNTYQAYQLTNTPNKNENAPNVSLTSAFVNFPPASGLFNPDTALP